MGGGVGISDGDDAGIGKLLQDGRMDLLGQSAKTDQADSCGIHHDAFFPFFIGPAAAGLQRSYRFLALKSRLHLVCGSG
jgi:hypothetical protein